MVRAIKYTTPSIRIEYERLVIDPRLRGPARDAIVERLNAKQESNNNRNKLKREERAFLREQAELLRQAQVSEQIAKKIEEGVQKEVARRLRASEKRKKERNIARMLANTNLLADTNVTGKTEIGLNQLWKAIKSLQVRLIYRVNNNIQEDTVLTIPDKYKAFRKFALEWTGLPYDSATTDIEGRFQAFTPSQVEASRLIQRFRDGSVHCVIDPLIAKLTISMESSKSQAVKKRTAQRIHTLGELMKEYDFVPEDKMEEVYKVAGIKMTMYDVMNNQIKEYNSNGKVGSMKTMNTRENHIDSFLMDCDFEDVDEDTMRRLYQEAKENHRQHGNLYSVDGDIKGGIPCKLRLLDRAYRLTSEIRDACLQMDIDVGIGNYRIDALKDVELNAFLKEGRIVNGWSCDVMGPTLVPTGCADMPKAYTQHKKCKFYKGFLGHIHQFREGVFNTEFMEAHIGYYRITILGGLDPLMEKMGFAVGSSYVLFSQEILYYVSLGLVVSSNVGAWGSSFDFEFPEYMLEDRRYAHWVGRLGMESTHMCTTIPATREWASHLKCDYDCLYWADEGLVTIRQPLKHIHTTHHIFGAVTAYLRIQMMEAMRLFDITKICRVVMDGIYHTGEAPEGLSWFKHKDVKDHPEYSQPWYESCGEYEGYKTSRIIRNTLLSGQGGSGKTYSILTDKGFINVLYVTPTRLLGMNMYEKHGVRWTTIHKLIGVGCVPYRDDHVVPSVLLVDELTMSDASWIDKVFEMYPECLILVAGDIDAEGRWYQCRSGKDGVFNAIWKPHDVDIIEYLTDYRARDEELKTLKLAIREQMRKCCGDEIDALCMKAWAYENLTFSPFDYKEGDTIIAGTHKTNQKILDMGIISGYYKTGGEVSSTPAPGFTARGSFTTHSYQGQTITEGNVWIVIDDAFEYAMLYTAISRCVSYSQLRFVKTI
jgi:hypothetical protein